MNAVTEAKKISKHVFSVFVLNQEGKDKSKESLGKEYYDNFIQLVSNLRMDLNTPEMPVFILTPLSDEDLAKKTFADKYKCLMLILRAQNRAGRDIPNTVTVVHGMDLPLVEKRHYNTEGQLTLVKMTAYAVEEFYKAKE